MWENTCATTQPAAEPFPLNSTSMDALVVGPLKRAQAKTKKEVHVYRSYKQKRGRTLGDKTGTHAKNGRDSLGATRASGTSGGAGVRAVVGAGVCNHRGYICLVTS